MSDTVFLSIDDIFTPYKRPHSGIYGWISRRLGPLPEQARYFPPDKVLIKSICGYRLLALALVGCAIAMLLGLSSLHPILRMSPFSLINSGVQMFASGWVASILVTVLVAGLFYTTIKLGGNMTGPNDGRFFDWAAMREELWFRTGAENWSSWQRLRSCVLFGGVHVFNVIYPVCSLLVLMIIGYAFMRTYLHHYNRTGSHEIATLHSTKLHATFNRFAVLYLLAAIMIVTFWN